MFYMSGKSSTLVFLLTLIVACNATGDSSSDNDSPNESANESQQVVDELERRASRSTKCPGCHTLLADHNWAPANRLCAGDPATISNPDTRRKTTKSTKSKKKSKSKTKPTNHDVVDTHLSDVTSRLDSAISSAEAALRQTTNQQTNQLSEADYLLQLRNLEREFQEEETRLTAQDEIRQLEQKLEEQQQRIEALRSKSENNASHTGPASLPTAAGSSGASTRHVAPVPLDSLIGQMPFTSVGLDHP